MAGLPTSRHAAASLSCALVLSLASCETRPLPPGPDDGADFGEGESESVGDDEVESSGDGDGDEGEGDSGSAGCSIVVDELTITDETPPESVACVEEVLGNLTIGPTTDLDDLSLISNLREVGGTIYVFGNTGLDHLYGLEQLERAEHLHVRRNHKLGNLHGLDSLAAVDRITVVNNKALVSLAGLPDGLAPQTVEIGENDVLQNLDGLPLFESPSPMDAVIVEVRGNPMLTDLGGLSDCCGTQAASLHIIGNPMLTDLGGLEDFARLHALRLHDNFALTSVNGLGNLFEARTLDVRYDHCSANTPSLVDLSGATQLSRIDNLQIQWVSSLTTLAALEDIAALEKLMIRNNAMLPWAQVSTLIAQTGPTSIDACGGLGGPECVTEPCETF